MTPPGSTFVSVVIGTQGSADVMRTLNALCEQTYPSELTQVVVVMAGERDDSTHPFAEFRAPYDLRIVQERGQTRPAARNAGASKAGGELLLFLNDDVTHAPSLIEAHVRAHGVRRDQVIVGRCSASFRGRGRFVDLVDRAYWSDKFSAMRQPGHRFTYRDLPAGNFSMPAELFARVGGFDPAVPGPDGDGHELGARLIASGAQFAVAEDAVALEHRSADLRRALRRIREGARGDILLGRKHVALRPTLLLVHFQHQHSFSDRVVHALAYRHAWLGDALAAMLRWTLALLERLRLRNAWRRVFVGLQHYWYLRGASDELRTSEALADFLQGGPARIDQDGEEIEIDVSGELEVAERRLDELRPHGARLRYGRQVLGRIPAQAGAEPLRGAHLRWALAGHLARPLLRALALERGRLGDASAGPVGGMQRSPVGAIDGLEGR